MANKKQQRTLTAEDEKFFENLDQAELETTGLGYSTNPDDHLWIGENGELYGTDWIYEHLGEIHPLEHILLSIIEAHPDPEIGDTRYRLEHALKFLVGRKPRRGPKPGRREKLLLIAEDWWIQNCQGTDSPNLSNIIKNTVIDQDDLRRLNPEQISNQIHEWRDAFKNNMSDLLKVVSGRGMDEQKDRRAKEQKVLRLLAELGVENKEP